MKKTNITITMLCLAAACACGDTKITWLADVTADRAETVTGPQSNDIAAAAAHIPRTDNPHGVTAVQIGALTAEQDLAALRAWHYGSPEVVESPAGWFEFDASTGAITGFNNAPGRENVVVPWAIGGVPVTAIGGGAFGESGIVSVIAPHTTTSIVDYAFYACTLLTSVSLPQATAIGDYAFCSCGSLTSVHMGQNAPAEATGVFAYITPPTVYVTDPQATGWGDTWNGAPVVRPPLYGSNVTAQAFTLGGDTITEWPEGGGSVPYTDWTGTVTPVGGTATVTYAHGNMPVLVTDAPCVLTLDPTGYGTAGVSRVSLSYYTGTNSFTFATNVITYSATPTVDTNGWNTLLIRRVSDSMWKGVGL
jgi:hypothetical protein